VDFLFLGKSENKRRAKVLPFDQWPGGSQLGSKAKRWGPDFLAIAQALEASRAFDMPLLVKARSFVRNLFLPAAWK